MEELSEKPQTFGELVAQKEQEGWQYVGFDQTKDVKFTDDAKFTEQHVRTEEEIIQKHKRELEDMVRNSGQVGEVELQLIPKQDFVQGDFYPDKYGTQFIFAKFKK